MNVFFFFAYQSAGITFYFLIVLPSVTYALVVWDSCQKTFLEEQEKINVRAAKIIFGLNSGTRRAARC